jgi:hypothetical protein
MALADELLDDLGAELEATDPDYNSAILSTKINVAIKKVTNARNYPDYYTQETINTDLEKFYTQIRDIALYMYNNIGVDFDKNYTSNKMSREVISESELYRGINKIARV